MGTTAVAIAKAAIAALSDPKTRKAIGWTLVAILSPIILLIAFICSLGAGAAEHNVATVDYCFHGGSITGDAPQEYRNRTSTIHTCFHALELATRTANAGMRQGISLDTEEIKSAFLALCSEDPSVIDIARFVGCFFTSGSYAEGGDSTINIPLSRPNVFAKLSALLGRPITADDKSNIDRIYALACGSSEDGSYSGDYLRGDAPGIELDISGFTDPTTKNAADLVVYAKHAWADRWGYVWGTYGNVLTESLLEYKVQQYPDGVGQYESFIRSHWLGGRTTDCVGLIKSYGWLDPNDLTICYGTNGMPDVGANSMHQNATVKGPMSTMPDTPGLAVWMNGHIGVYIGGGEVIEASSTQQGVIKTKLEGRGWTEWLQVPYISYT